MGLEIHRQYHVTEDAPDGISMSYGASLAPEQDVRGIGAPDFSDEMFPHIAATDHADEVHATEVGALGLVSGLSHMRHGGGMFAGLDGIQTYSLGPDGTLVTVATGVAHADAVSDQTASLARAETVLFNTLTPTETPAQADIIRDVRV